MVNNERNVYFLPVQKIHNVYEFAEKKGAQNFMNLIMDNLSIQVDLDVL